MVLLPEIFNILPLAEAKPRTVKRDSRLHRNELSFYREVIKALPSVREEKVTTFQKAIAAGEYRIDPYKIAQKMLEWSLLDLVFSSS